MSAETDPLLLLRNALTSNATLTLLSHSTDPPTEVFTLSSATHIRFPSSLSLPKATPTRYLSAAAPGAPAFDLQSLLLAFLRRDGSAAEYMNEVRELGIGFVSVLERRGVVDWLCGRGDIDGPPGRILPLGGASAAAAVEGGAEGDATGELHDLSKAGVEQGASSSGAIRDRDGDASMGGERLHVAKRPKYVLNREDQEKVKMLMKIIEGPSYGTQTGEGRPDKDLIGYKTRATVLRGDRMNNFETARVIATPRIALMREQVSSKSKDAPIALGSSSTGSSNGPRNGKKKALTPIILISPSSSALITMHNVKRFLEESVYETLDDIRTREGTTGGRVAEDVVQVNHARTTSTISSSLAGNAANEGRKSRYFIVDSIEALAKFGGTDEAWDRVVCVMTTGQEWQFQPYKWKEPKELFHHVKGVFVQWTLDAPNVKVRSWNVTELRIDPVKRHIDKSTVADFWRSLESWISMHKPWLSY